jgi:hypothetical protein
LSKEIDILAPDPMLGLKAKSNKNHRPSGYVAASAKDE